MAINRILMKASGHPDDHDDSVHALLANGRVPCGRAYSANHYTKTVKALTCERCMAALRTKS